MKFEKLVFVGLPIVLLLKCVSQKALFLLWLQINCKQQKMGHIGPLGSGPSRRLVLAQFWVQKTVILGHNLTVHLLTLLDASC